MAEDLSALTDSQVQDTFVGACDGTYELDMTQGNVVVTAEFVGRTFRGYGRTMREAMISWLDEVRKAAANPVCPCCGRPLREAKP